MFVLLQGSNEHQWEDSRILPAIGQAWGHCENHGKLELAVQTAVRPVVKHQGLLFVGLEVRGGLVRVERAW